jgi:hypothetical protein
MSRNEPNEIKERKKGMSIWIFIGIIAAWFFLQAYLLPRLGIST